MEDEERGLVMESEETVMQPNLIRVEISLGK